MTGRRLRPGEAGPIELATEGGRFVFRRLDRGVLACEREHAFDTDVDATDVSGRFWLLGLAEVERGVVELDRGAETLSAAPRYGVFLPPHAVTRSVLRGVHQRIHLILSDRAVPRRAFERATLFTPPPGPLPERVDELADYLAAARDPRPVDPVLSAATRRAKAILDAHLFDRRTLGDIAAEAGTSHAAMTRRFRREVGLTPVRYRNAARVLAAAMTLLDGHTIGRAAYDVGYGDLSRFYAQFRRVTGVTPKRFSLTRK